MANVSANLPADAAYVASQYKDSTKLHARLRLYERYAERGQPSLHCWAFDAIDFPSAAKVLEVGCGLARCVAVSRYDFQHIDAHSVPLPDAAFDVVIANHMLYHLADRARALRELRRVLRPGGKLLREHLEWVIALQGSFHITLATGLFIGSRLHLATSGTSRDATTP